MEFTLILLGCFLFIYTYIGSDWASHYSADPVGTAAIPRFYLILLIICNILILFSHKKQNKVQVDKDQNKEMPTLNFSQSMILYLFAFTTILYIYATWYIGLFVSTFIFLLAWLTIFGNGIKRTLVLSILGTLGIYILMNLAQVFFPEGILF